MTKEVPFISLNPDGLMSTNTVHNVVFLEGINENTKKWIQFSMFTSITQLSVELAGRTYGGGVLKIEPTAANNILVFPGNGLGFPKNLECKLNSLLIQGKRREAMNLADKWMINNSNISKKDIYNIASCYQSIRNMRLGLDKITKRAKQITISSK
jgi:hypothetical protein